MDGQAACAPPRRAHQPLAAALDPGRDHRGHRADRGGGYPAVGGNAALMTPADDIEDADPGLARERTELSWTRTAISFAALGGAVLKSRPYAGISILVLSGLIWELGQVARASGAGRAGPGGSPADRHSRHRRVGRRAAGDRPPWPRAQRPPGPSSAPGAGPARARRTARPGVAGSGRGRASAAHACRAR